MFRDDKSSEGISDENAGGSGSQYTQQECLGEDAGVGCGELVVIKSRDDKKVGVAFTIEILGFGREMSIASRLQVVDSHSASKTAPLFISPVPGK